MDLKTDEVFQSSRFAAAKGQEDKAITATLFIACKEREAAGPNLLSAMCYVPGKLDRAAELWLKWRLSPEQLVAFQALIVAGKKPRSVAITFAPEPLEYGWEPDGRHTIWDNEKRSSLIMEDVSLAFDAQSSVRELDFTAELSKDTDPEVFSHSASVNFSMITRLGVIGSSLKRLSWTAVCILLLLIVQAASHYWH
jgi:hypothetical protein